MDVIHKTKLQHFDFVSYVHVYLCSCHVAKENIYSIMEKISSFVPVYGYGDGVFICRYRRNCTDEIASLKAFLSVFNHFLCVMKYSSHNIFLTIYLKWNGVFETDDGYGCHPRSSICLHSLSSLLPVMGCHIRTQCTLSIRTLRNQAFWMKII